VRRTVWRSKMYLTSFGGALSAELNEGLTNRRPFNSIGEGHKSSYQCNSVDLTIEVRYYP
ncbi:MAG: hypothetical protein ACTS4T_00765, partial [Candidatus Hodgkinia cicadicola]